MPVRLIVNADDFGLTPGINRGVAELYRAGALSSATLMANGTAFAEAVEVAAAHPGLGVGCHLVLVDGMPVGDAAALPTLCPDGKTFRDGPGQFVWDVLRGAIDPEEVLREATAQIAKLLDVGIPVTHVDTHKHVHAFPRMARMVVQAARACGVRAVRRPFEPDWSATVSQAPRTRRAELALMRSMEPAFRRASQGVLQPRGTVGMAATGTLDEDVLRATLDAVVMHDPDGTYELCCHPGYVDAGLRGQKTRLLGEREAELRALLEVVPQIVRSAERVELIHYGKL